MKRGPLSDAERAALRASTHDAALVLVDDLQHVRQIVTQEMHSAGDVRRLSNQLRRILVEGDLRKIAAPRLGKIEIDAPDLRHIYRADEKKPFLFIAADGLQTHGLQMAAMRMDEGPNAREIPGYHPDQMVRLRIETFQNQKILCVRGAWVTRADVIKYIANVASGVHSGDAKEPAYKLIRKIRHACIVTVNNGVPSISFNIEVLASDDPPISFNPAVIDIALMHLISTAQFLTSSENVIELGRLINESG